MHYLSVQKEEDVFAGMQSLHSWQLIDLCHQNITECQQESTVTMLTTAYRHAI